MSPTLPKDVLDNILTSLVHHRDLANCCLVSRRFSQIAQPRLDQSRPRPDTSTTDQPQAQPQVLQGTRVGDLQAATKQLFENIRKRALAEEEKTIIGSEEMSDESKEAIRRKFRRQERKRQKRLAEK